jgi:distribution and morphology protein 34
MAFNFNWSPLAADADFYSRAQEMLTTALNKSPKPPIIVDDILVNELNLGSVPPDLEILEIGDLAEDRFRGIFKMCYSGDSFLTLKTRVQVRAISMSSFVLYTIIFSYPEKNPSTMPARIDARLISSPFEPG